MRVIRWIDASRTKYRGIPWWCIEKLAEYVIDEASNLALPYQAQREVSKVWMSVRRCIS